jgi:catalase
MLQGRLLSYPDAQRYRLGVNFEQIPVNRCPFDVHNYHRDGMMRIDENGGSAANYYPNSFDDMYVDLRYEQPAMLLESPLANWYDRNAEGENDHFTQPGLLFRKVMNDREKRDTIHNIVEAMKGISGPEKENIINRQLCHWFRVDELLGTEVAKGLQVNIDEVMTQLKHHPELALGSWV